MENVPHALAASLTVPYGRVMYQPHRHPARAAPAMATASHARASRRVLP